jgi:hypothetical protein
MANIRSTDMMFIDDIFEMGGGYVLDFSDRSIAAFFAEELNIEFDNPVYEKYGRSKAKRLRCLLQTVDLSTAVRTLRALWERREALRERAGRPETLNNARGRFLALVARLEGKPIDQQATESPRPQPAFDRARIAQVKADLLAIAAMEAQARGYAFERVLTQFFNVFGLEAREPFRLRGEQIDGSFLLGSETYLVEAKWQGQQTGVADLHVFHGKIEQKAAWTRGLFISNSGFTADGLVAFGRGKRVICMDGLDLYQALDREIPISLVLEKKVRRAAETGLPFVSVRDLFP